MNTFVFILVGLAGWGLGGMLHKYGVKPLASILAAHVESPSTKESSNDTA